MQKAVALGLSSRRGFHNLCASDKLQTLFTYTYVCVSWVSSDCKEAQLCKTSSVCLNILFAPIVMECTSLPVPDLGETQEWKTKKTSNPSGFLSELMM